MAALSLRLTLAALFLLYLSFWFAARGVYTRWNGTPPVPALAGALSASLNDAELSYRGFGLMLQNLGDVGRDVTPLKNYDYARLKEWFFLLHRLDPASDHMPMVAAHYFGATKVPKDAAEIVAYLRVAGQAPYAEKWRWLAHAAFLAQHRMKDPDLALAIAYDLQRLARAGVDMPQWARAMPAFVLANKGEAEAAKAFMSNLLVTDSTPHPEEVYFMKSFLIERAGMKPEEVEALARMRGDGIKEKDQNTKP